MLNGKRIVVVMPAYNASRTLRQTYAEIPHDVVDAVLYQYTPRLIPAMAAMITSGIYDVVLGSRVLGRGALAGDMPLYKFVSNRVLTCMQNIVFHQRLTEYHTGYRAFSRAVLLRLPLEQISDDFVFDNEMLAQLIWFKYEIAEITCPARYFKEASSTGVWRSTVYRLGVVRTTCRYLLARAGIRRDPMFDPNGKKLRDGVPESRPSPAPTMRCT